MKAAISLAPQPAGAGDLVRVVKCLAISDGNLLAALEIAENVKSSPRVLAILKSAVAAGTTTDGNWASALSDYTLAQAAFVESLQRFGCFDRLLADSAVRKMPMKTRISTITAGAVGSVPGEGSWKPITSVALASAQLNPIIASAILVMSRELVRAVATGAEAALSRELRSAVASASDLRFFEAILDDSEIASTAGSVDDVDGFGSALDFLFEAVELGQQSRPYLVFDPVSAKRVALMRTPSGWLNPAFGPSGGSIQNVPALISDQLTSRVVLLDANRIAAADGPVVFDAAGAASLQMDSAPTGSASQMVSMFQTDSVALRAEREIGAELLSASAAAFVELGSL
jgi:hypothetical protein